MKNKSLKLAVLSGFTLLSINANANVDSHRFDGAYGGVSIGYLNDSSVYSLADIPQNFSGAPLGPGILPSVQYINDKSFKSKNSTDFSGGVYLGYSHVFGQNFYSAIEGKYSYFNENEYDVNSNGTKLIYNNACHLILKAGAVIKDDFLIYVKGGYVNANLKYDSPVNTETSTSGKKSTIKNGGIEYGLGFAAALTEKISLGLEISKIVIEKEKFTQPAINNGGIAHEVQRTIKPRLDIVELNLSYKF